MWNKGLFPQSSNVIRLIEGAVPIHLHAGLEPRIKKILFLPVQELYWNPEDFVSNSQLVQWDNMASGSVSIDSFTRLGNKTNNIKKLFHSAWSNACQPAILINSIAWGRKKVCKKNGYTTRMPLTNIFQTFWCARIYLWTVLIPWMLNPRAYCRSFFPWALTASCWASFFMCDI